MALSAKEDFINRIITIYGGNMSAATKKEYYKACDEVLKGNIDYRKLWQYFLHEFDTKTIGNAPSPQWLGAESKRCLIIEEKEPPKIEGVPCPPEIKAKMDALLRKIKASA